MKLKYIGVIFVFPILIALTGCKPDKIEVEIYASDLKKVASQGIVEVPIVAIFSILGNDESNLLSKSSVIARKYLDQKAEIKMTKGEMGDVMVVKCAVPMGTEEELSKYLVSNNRPIALVINGSSVKIKSTEHMKNLNIDIEEINMILNVEMPAENTFIRLVGDLEDSLEIRTVAVFIDKKPELIFKKKLARRENVEIEYKGGAESVYSQIEPQFLFKF